MALIKISGLIPTMWAYESMAPADPHTICSAVYLIPFTTAPVILGTVPELKGQP